MAASRPAPVRTALLRRALLATALLLALAPAAAWGSGFAGRIAGAEGEPVVGARVTVRFGAPFQERTVFSDAEGRYALRGIPPGTETLVRVRRLGWRDARLEGRRTPDEGLGTLDVALERESDPEALAAQLPANHWFDLVLERVEEAEHREQLVRQCTYCHQQGSRATRLRRDPEEWRKVLALMARMGGTLDEDLRERVPELFNAAYAEENAVPRLAARLEEPEVAAPPPPPVRRAVIDEWELGKRSSMQHDVAVGPDGAVWSVDMMNDELFRLAPDAPGGGRERWRIPREGLEPGGVFGSGSIMPPNADSAVGPHSIQVAPDGALWITLAIGNRLARFDPETESWSTETLPSGFYPHTLRFDERGRLWYTIAVSNHVGVYDPSTGRHETVRVPARSYGEAFGLRLLPAVFWLARWVDLGGFGATAEGDALPVPYGIDIAPDGGVWFSQLNAHKIGRIDPETLEVRMIETPFSAPRRLRFDSEGRLWIPGFSSSVLARFDPETEAFRTWDLPIRPRGTETPYALNVAPDDTVWVCGTNSDTLIRFEPERERFTVYPLPTRVTYTREIDFGPEGGVWSSNSNLPAWQIETGIPRVLRLRPEGAPATRVGAR